MLGFSLWLMLYYTLHYFTLLRAVFHWILCEIQLATHIYQYVCVGKHKLLSFVNNYYNAMLVPGKLRV